MDTLSLQLFLRVVEHEQLSSAARDLSLSAATASARLAKLEETISFRLFNRTTRAVSLTTDGAAFLPYAQQALETLESGVNLVSSGEALVKGVLRIGMPGSFGRMYIIPALPEFKRRYPQIKLDLKLSDDFIDIVEGGYDLSIRNAPLADSSFIARKLADDHRMLVASPGYLDANGTPTTPDELKTHQWVTLLGQHRIKFQNGTLLSAESTIDINDGEAMRYLLEDGMGIGIKSAWNANQSIQSGKLVEVLADFPLVTASSIWAIYPSNRIVSPKVRAMINFLLEIFRPVPPWKQQHQEEQL